MYPIQSCIVTGPALTDPAPDPALDPGQRPTRRRAATVERLLDAALPVFAEVGYAACSIEDLCGRAGLTRGAFYSSFSSKDELFAALMSRECARDLVRAEQLLAGLGEEADPVAAAVDRCTELLRQDRDWTLVSTEYALHAARHPAAAELLARARADVLAQVTACIERVTTAAGIPLAVPAADLASAVLALHEGISLQRLGRGAAAVPGELERTTMHVLLRGAFLPLSATTPEP